MDIDSISPSRLKIAKTCTFKYFLRYIWGWSDELFLYTFASPFGTAVHATLEEYANEKGNVDYEKVYKESLIQLGAFKDDMMKAPSKARAAFFTDKKCLTCKHFNEENNTCSLVEKNIDLFDGCPLSLYNDGLYMIQSALDRYRKYFHTGLKTENNPNGKVLGIEAPAQICWGKDCVGDDIMMNGFIDLVVEYDHETLLIIDYKTGFSIPSYDEFIEELQPRMYSYAAKKMYPGYKYYWVQFDYFRGIPIEATFTDNDDLITQKRVIEIVNEIKSAKKVSRRAFDRECKYLCNRPFCDQKWTELKSGIDGSNPSKREDPIIEE